MTFEETFDQLADEILMKIRGGMKPDEALTLVLNNHEYKHGFEKGYTRIYADHIKDIVLTQLKVQTQKCSTCTLQSGCPPYLNMQGAKQN